jgi:hypothetical protein
VNKCSKSRFLETNLDFFQRLLRSSCHHFLIFWSPLRDSVDDPPRRRLDLSEGDL